MTDGIGAAHADVRVCAIAADLGQDAPAPLALGSFGRANHDPDIDPRIKRA